MRKILFSMISIMIISTSVFAQDAIRIGATGGLINSNTSVKFSEFATSLLDLNSINHLGYFIGAIGDFPVNDKLHLQVELTYGSADDLSFVFLPVVAKFYIVDGLNVQVGSQLSISNNVDYIKLAIQDIDDVVRTNENLDDVIRKTGLDFVFGAGYDITSHLSVRARYSIEITNRYNGPLNNNLKVKAATLNVGVAYFL